MTNVIPGLMMPAFRTQSHRACPEVLLMIEVDRGDRAGHRAETLVASNRPPRPTSITAISTPERRKPRMQPRS